MRWFTVPIHGYAVLHSSFAYCTIEALVELGLSLHQNKLECARVMQAVVTAVKFGWWATLLPIRYLARFHEVLKVRAARHHYSYVHFRNPSAATATSSVAAAACKHARNAPTRCSRMQLVHFLLHLSGGHIGRLRAFSWSDWVEPTCCDVFRCLPCLET